MSGIARGDIIRMAQEAGICDGSFDFQMVSLQDLERFAVLVAAAEREACARICGERAQGWAQAKLAKDDVEGCMRHAAKNEARALGEAIRQRGRGTAARRAGVSP